MKLIRLDILNMPGFEERPLALRDLSPGLNIILGPNASGKTTACRAIAGLLWPETLKNLPDARISADWSDAAGSLRIEARGARAVCVREGLPVDFPALPPVHCLHSYVVTLDDLFESGGAYDAHLAQAVLREMAGGFDLRALRDLPFMSASYKSALAAAKALAEERRAVAAVRQAQSRLRQEEAGLPARRLEYEAACRAAAELELTGFALQLKKVDCAVACAQSALAGFPAPVGRLNGGEVKLLEELKQERAARQQLLSAEEARLQKLQSELVALGLPPERICAPDLQGGRELLEQLRRNAEKHALICHQNAQKEGELASFGAKKSGDLALVEDGSGDSRLLARMEILQHHWDEAAHEHRLLSTETAFLEGQLQAAADGRQELLQQGVLVLRRWLRAPSGEQAEQLSRLIVLLTAVTLLLAGMGGVLALRFDLRWLLLELIPAAVATYLLLRAGASPEDQRTSLRALYAGLLLEQPAEWRHPAVGALLERLEQELQNVTAALQARSRWTVLKARLAALDQRLSALQADRAAAASELGLPAETPAFELPLFVQRLIQRRQLLGELRGLQTVLGELAQVRAKLLTEFNRLVGGHIKRQSGSLEEAAAALHALEEALRRQALLTKDCANLSERAVQLKNEGLALDRKIAGVFEAAGLTPAEEPLLLQCAGQLQAFRDLRQQLRDLEGRRTWLQAELAEKAPHLLPLSTDEIKRRQADLSAAASRRDALRDELAGTTRAVEDARRGRSLEEALQREAAALHRLAALQEQSFAAAAGNLLLDQVEEEFSLESEPAVFREAARLFELFTSGSCRLLHARRQAETPGFRALDAQSGKQLELHQLSRGTRMQLQLAARVAFVGASEAAVKLPLIIDEALTAADPHRFLSAAAALLKLAAEGRQVLYFSCRPSDAAMWEAAAAQAGAPRPQLIKLGDPATVETSLLTRELGTELPSPDGRSLEEYVRLVAPPAIKPARGAGPAHLAHIVDDVRLLHRLLSVGITCFGQLETLAGRGALETYLDRPAYDLISARAAVLTAFQAAWQIGRGRALTQSVIERTCPTEAHLQAILDKAEELNWDPKALLEAIDPDRGKAVKKLRRPTYEEFEAALSEMGYLPEELPLNREQALAAVLAAVNSRIRDRLLSAREVHGLFEALWDMQHAPAPRHNL